ncbi:hypothetical protein P153DRAFT_361645 [Dothidotthia symphoricarpi CBS 119687]|uniref:BTB domain-containing protein n=1 Tax=Dothidotthia symphoricarpi CBS 119687 TaxID=1392245 RepID=A0A6A5ZYC8_9PLEO|nr:uncharacterized protein P153DRAFT_361645 [Dothidotthia symphoricarpi CBS 119687]KAF2124025.1 hypothetical protein P153DRAFT_361645 [Dothidotthia symphoricarpi CBS 119687]
MDTHDPHAAQDQDREDFVQIGNEPALVETWSFDALDAVDSPTSASASASASTAPRVSLFSPNVPAEVHHEETPPNDASSAAHMLPALANMTKRTARLKVSDEHPPIVQLHTQIPRAQKSGDDPSTPLENKSRKRTTHDLVGNEHATLTTLSRLFGETTMANSRAPSYNNATGPLYLRASNEAIPLPDHLYTRGLLQGRHSDITVVAFGQRYNLHRLILDRAPFFTTALSEPWIESQAKEVSLYPERIDPSITQAAFELAIRKLYGVEISKDSDVEAVGLFATGCWLEMQDLIDSAIESILRQMAPDTLAYLIRLVTTNYYGRSGDRILESAKAMLSRNGWEMPLKYWDDMPGDIIRELVGSDGFFVDSEWDRWVLTKRLLDRRLRQAAIEAGLIQRGQRPIPQAPQSMRLMAVRFDGVYRQNSLTMSQSSTDVQGDWLALYTSPDIERILVLLDEGIHYIHMEYEQLGYIKTARDVFGLPVMPERVISNALWQQLSLRQIVLNVDESSQELGLCQAPPEPETANAGTKTEGEVVVKGKQKAVEIAPVESEVESESWDGNGKPRKFWIPSSDCNIVLGNGVDPVVTTSSTFQRHATRLSASMQPEDAQWATDFASTPSNMAHPNTRMDNTFRPISAGGSNAGQPKPIAYTEFPPFRFAAEFPNPRFLKEKKRVYSRTVSYAGSLWNIYIQKVRSAKNVQLGVYLHRAKEESTEAANISATQPNDGSVDARIGQLEREMLMRSDRRERRRSTREPFNDQTAEEDTSGSGGDPDSTLVSANRNPRFSTDSTGRRRSTTLPHITTTRNLPRFQFQPLGSSPPTHGENIDSPGFPADVYSPSDHDYISSDDDDDELHAIYPNPSLTTTAQRKSRLAIPALPPYVDGRPTIKTYFKIYSPSKGGRMLSIYESAPDRFNFSQSWGWKSSTLMLDEVAISGSADEAIGGAGGVPVKKGDGKLRFMVVIGNL